MILPNNYYYFKNAVSIKTCEKILKTGRKKIARQANVLIKDNKGKRKTGLDPLKRNSKVAWINEKWIYDIINPFIHVANKQAGWNFQWDWNETSQFTIYEKDQYYGWHADQNARPNNNKDKNFDGKIRKLSLTLQLTDKIRYTGGDFQFMWLQSNKKDCLNIVTVDDAKDIGTIIVFPSFIYHQVLPVTGGKRECLVNWSLGRKFN